MTEPADVTITDGAPDDPATDEPDGTFVLTPDGPTIAPHDPPEATADPEPDPDPTPEQLASIGALSGEGLADHLGVEGLEAHAAAQIETGGPADGTQAPAGAVQHDARREALYAWTENPTYHDAFHVGDVKYSTCGLCSVLVGPDHDWHTETHRRTGE